MNLALAELELPIWIRRDRPITDDELLRLSADNELLRLERDASGELIVMSATGSEGGGMESDVNLELGIWARADGRGRVFGPNTGFRLPETSVRAADAAWVSFQQWNALTRAERRKYAPICPEFVIEVRSETDRLPNLQAKMQLWIANGAQLAWLIDPIERAVSIYRPGQSPEVHNHPTSVQGDGIMAGFELVMARIWD